MGQVAVAADTVAGTATDTAGANTVVADSVADTVAAVRADTIAADATIGLAIRYPSTGRY